MNNLEQVIEKQMLNLAQKIADDMANFMRSNEMQGLSNTVKGKVSNENGTITAYIEMQEYGKYLLLGVRGAKDIRRAPNSPFAFRRKMPPVKALEPWINKKGIKGKDGKSLSPYALSKSIFYRGLSPKPNFIQPVWNEQVANKFKEQMQEAIGKEIEAIIYT